MEELDKILMREQKSAMNEMARIMQKTFNWVFKFEFNLIIIHRFNYYIITFKSMNMKKTQSLVPPKVPSLNLKSNLD